MRALPADSVSFARRSWMPDTGFLILEGGYRIPDLYWRALPADSVFFARRSWMPDTGFLILDGGIAFRIQHLENQHQVSRIQDLRAKKSFLEPTVPTRSTSRKEIYSR